MTEPIIAAFVPLVDCAVLAVAREIGFAAAEGFDLELVKEPSWASLRDHLSLGHVDCAHALAPLPIAATLGVGPLQTECFVPFVLGRGGNAITVSKQLYDEMTEAADGAELATPAAAAQALAAAVRGRDAPPTLGMVFPFSTHNFELRYWLASAGLNPDRDLRLVAIPPPRMVESLRAGHVDGFCVGEPWNSLAVAADLGRIVATKSQLLPRGLEKVLAVRAPLEREPERLGALLRALAAAAAWADDPAHHAALATLLARPAYLGAREEPIAAALAGRLRLGAGRTMHDPDFVYFHRHGANVPSAAEALWLYAQMLRWGQLAPSAERQTVAQRVFRADLYRRFVAPDATSASAPVPFDGVELDPYDVRAYLAQFPIATPHVETASVD